MKNTINKIFNVNKKDDSSLVSVHEFHSKDALKIINGYYQGYFIVSNKTINTERSK